MKRTALARLALVLLPACATLEVVPPASLAHQHVFEVSLKKEQIYAKSLEWMARTFVDSKEVIELRDPENGKIVGKGVTQFENGALGISASIPCRYTMIIEIKDGRYRTSYENLTAMWGQYRNMPHPLQYREHVDQVMANLDALDRNLYTFLTAETKTDW